MFLRFFWGPLGERPPAGGIPEFNWNNKTTGNSASIHVYVYTMCVCVSIAIVKKRVNSVRSFKNKKLSSFSPDRAIQKNFLISFFFFYN
jgi:hypothetical protein